MRDGENSLSTRAAATNIESVTRRAPDAITPKPTPGKMKALLHWPILTDPCSVMIGGNGLPVAISPRPPVHLKRSIGLASLFEVGFESGKITGRATCFAISDTMSSLN